MALNIKGKCLMTSENPIIANRSIWIIRSSPASIILSPPWPTKRLLGDLFLIALISFAPCKSPDASPATIKNVGLSDLFWGFKNGLLFSLVKNLNPQVNQK